ncbi:MAG: hypothetical protein KDA31_06705 [Phycisphaerales bacterium]|nr:hypothetical protein [Phycisphaerales bacterium]MCB9836013.1 hypothetical protein [Phycisphaera sp.]
MNRMLSCAILSSSLLAIAPAYSQDPCKADVNKDGSVDPADQSSWVAAYNAMDEAADQNSDGQVTPADWSAFIANYNAGCDTTDHDSDGIISIYENNGGTWVANYMTGTDPMNPDSDGDGLSDFVETRTYVYFDLTHTGTDPNIDDTDGDTIDDGDEVLGTSSGLDLPGLGANPLHKDIFIELDWHEPLSGSNPDAYQPPVGYFDILEDMFSNAPLSNPDGVDGIVVHIDMGQGGLYSGGNRVSSAHTSPISLNQISTQIQSINLDSNRVGYFYYCLYTDRSLTGGGTGQGELNGDTLAIRQTPPTNPTFGYSYYLAHELGHCMGLRHGGFEDINFKPNYNSIMNYRFATGLDVDGDGGPGDEMPDLVLDYSVGIRPVIFSDSIDESVDLYGGALGSSNYLDWNQNGILDMPYPYDITVPCGSGTSYLPCGQTCPTGCPSIPTNSNNTCTSGGNSCCANYAFGGICWAEFRDFDDWSAIRLTPLLHARASSPEIITCVLE